MPVSKIDFVLPYVDGNNLAWRNNKKKYRNTSEKVSDGAFRFRDMNTLKYVLRSIENHCPWYGTIHIVTCGHYPKWLNINHPKINLITHEELYFYKSHLSTFNSSSIEMNLANLHGVSEQFVYLNDDMVIFNQIEEKRFFQNGKAVDFLSHGWIPRNKVFRTLKNSDTWVMSLNNALNLINKKLSPIKPSNGCLYHESYDWLTKIRNFLLKNMYGNFFWLEHWHHPQPYLMKTLKEVYSTFESDMMACSKNRFRADNDLTQYLYRYWHLGKGEFIPYKHNDGFCKSITSVKTLRQCLNKINTYDTINFVCFNDSPGLSDLEFAKVKTMMTDYLESVFPKKASFEKLL